MIDLLFDKKWTIIKVVLPTFFYKKLVFGPFLRVELLDLTEKTATSSSSTGHLGILLDLAVLHDAQLTW